MTDRQRKSYTREFRKKAVELALTSGHPTSYVAKLLKIKESTLGNWVATYKRTHQSKATLKTEKARNKSKEPEFTERLFDHLQNSNEGHQQTLEASSYSTNTDDDDNNDDDTAIPDQQKPEPKAPTEALENTEQPITIEDILINTDQELPREIEKLRKQNQRLERERNIFREAIILLAANSLGVHG